MPHFTAAEAMSGQLAVITLIKRLEIALGRKAKIEARIVEEPTAMKRIATASAANRLEYENIRVRR